MSLRAQFEQFAAMAPSAREVALQALGNEDPERARRLRVMLASETRGETPLPDLGALVAGTLLEARRAAIEVHGFTPLRLLGRGGMGEVWLVERILAGQRQRLALKLLQSGCDPEEDLLRRFRTEQKILLDLEHPGITRLVDAGEAQGQPWIAMEFVDGLDVVSWCDQQRLGIEARLRLFQEVCAAVQFAHDRLIVHRDLKPANVLVGHDGRVKLLDFGIAKLLDSHAQTGTAQQLFSLYGVAPEQLRGQAPTVATDVYALGNLLYELLCGNPAQVFAGLSLSGIEQQVLHVSPPLPSRNIAPGLAASRAGLSVAGLRRRLQGELDRIVLHALRKQANERYSAVREFSADLGRHLDNQPVIAVGQGLGYRSRKLLRRHRFAASAAMLVLVLAVLFVIQLKQQRDTAEAARHAEVRARERADRVNAFLIGLFTQSSPREAGGPVMTARELLDRGLPRLLHTPQAHPGDAALLLAIAGAYADLGVFDAAQRAWTRAGSLVNPDQQTALEQLDQLRTGAEIAFGLADYPEALARIDAAAHLEREQLARDSALLELELLRARLQFAQGQVDPALATIEQARRNYGQSPQLSALQRADLDLADGRLRAVTGDHVQGLALLERGLAKRREAFSPQDPALADTLAEVARAASYLGRHERMRSAYEEARDIYQRAFGTHHHSYAQALNGLGVLAMQQSRLDEALALFNQSLAIREELLGPLHPSLAASHNNIAVTLHLSGQLEPALTAITRAEAIAARAFPDGHFTRDLFALERGRVLTSLARYAEAAQLLWTTRQNIAGSSLAQPRNLAKTELALAEMCAQLGDHAAANRLQASAAPVINRMPENDLNRLRLIALQQQLAGSGHSHRSATHPLCRRAVP